MNRSEILSSHFCEAIRPRKKAASTLGVPTDVARHRRLTAPARAGTVLFVAVLPFLHSGEARAQAQPGIGQQQLINVRERTDNLSSLGALPSQDIPPQVEGVELPASVQRLAFPVGQIRASGSTVYSEAQLAPLLQRYENRSDTLADLYALGRAIAAKYRADGYPYTTVVVPGQHLSNGRVEIRIVEFSIGDVAFQLDGKPVPTPPGLQPAVNDILASRPVRLDTLQRAEGRVRSVENLRVATTRVDRMNDGRLRLTVFLSRPGDQSVAIQPSFGALRQQQDPQQVRIPVRQIRLSGNTALSDERLAPLLNGLVGRVDTLAQLQDAARRIEARYAEAGYYGTVVRVPPQVVSDGVVTLEVSELRAGSVSVRLNGAELPPGDLLSRAANRVTLEQPLTALGVQRQLYVLNNIPGVTVQSVIPPVVGEADSQVFLQRKPWTIISALDNRGTNVTGRLEAGMLLGENGQLGLNEQIQLLGLESIPFGRVNFAGVQGVVPLSSSGLVANGMLTHTLAKPRGYLSPLDLAAIGDMLDLGLSYPLVARAGLSTLATLTFDAFNNIATSFGGQVTTSDERSRAVRFGIVNTYLDPLGGTSLVTATYSQGINGLGARPNGDQINSRPGIHLNAGKFRLDAQYTLPLPQGFKATLAARGVYGLSPLPSAELFTFGGVEFGRAYDGGIISGDRGYAGKIQLSRPMPLGNPIIPFIEPYIFYDNGEAFSLIKTPGISSSASAASTGIGTRFLTGIGAGGYLEVDKPLTHGAQIGSSRKPTRVFFLVFAQF